MNQGPSVVGLISDTHGLLRATVLEALKGSDLIIHAGDVGNPEVLHRLGTVARVIAVRGNIDKAAWADTLPMTAVAEVGAKNMYVVHDLQQLDLDPAAAGFQFVISGHSHKPAQSERSGVHYVNPGSAGPRRFRLPVTVARIDFRQEPWSVEFIDVSDSA